MKTTFRTIIISAALALASSALNIKADDGTNSILIDDSGAPGRFYLNVDGGGMVQQGVQFIQTFPEPGLTNSVTERDQRHGTFHPGGRVDLDIGYNIDKSFAAELETGLFWNSMDNIGTFHLASTPQAISQQGVPMMANLVYRFHGAGPITP
jgi:hypothetical protein